MKVYLVYSAPAGDFYDLLGVFSSEEKAEAAKELWLRTNAGHRGSIAFHPTIEELQIDNYIGKNFEGD